MAEKDLKDDAKDQDEEQLVDNDSRFLIFRLENELYGTPLLGVREIVENQNAKPVPNTVKHFLGVINLRGQVVGLIDLRKRFGLSSTKKEKLALLVFDTASGPLAAVVDKVEAVSTIKPSDINIAPNIQTKIPLQFLLGIARINKNLIHIIDLKTTLSAEELSRIRKVRNEKAIS